MSSESIRHVALVILEDADRRVALQLRDDIPTIHSPNTWAIFGGGIEEGESPGDAALREIMEELAIALDPDRLSFLGEPNVLPDRVFHVFWYRVADELDDAVLGEGQAWGRFRREQVMAGEIEGRQVASHHLEMLEWFWAHWGR